MAIWHIDFVGDPTTILVRIEGSIANQDAVDAARRTGALLRGMTTPVELCIDLRQMIDYTLSAREHWAHVLKAHKSKIRLLTYVTTSAMHRIVWRAVGLFTGVSTRVLDALPGDDRESQPREAGVG